VPRTRSAKKHQRQTKARTAVNRGQRSELRTAVKKVRAAATAEERKKAWVQAQKLLDRAGRKNLIHRNTASRTKARLAKLVAK